MNKKLLTIFAFLLISLNAQAEPLSMEAFYGKWTVHVEKTLERAKTTLYYKQRGASYVEERVKDMKKNLFIQVVEGKFIYDFSGKPLEAPYEVKEATEETITLDSQGGVKVELVYRLLEGGYMNYKSSASDDMDFYVWERVKE